MQQNTTTPVKTQHHPPKVDKSCLYYHYTCDKVGCENCGVGQHKEQYKWLMKLSLPDL